MKKGHFSKFKILCISLFIVTAMHMPRAIADNVSLLISSVKNSPISDLVQADGGGPVRTVGDVCSMSLEAIGGHEYIDFSSAEKAAALTILRRCMEIHNAHPSAIKAVEEAAKEERLIAKFKGLNWGIGVGLSQSQDDIIEEAVLVNGVVKTNVDRTDKVRIVLDMHIFIACNKSKGGVRRGCGPFLAVSPSDREILSGVGIGWMWGWKTMESEKSNAFTIGLGVMSDHNVKTLAAGFDKGQPLPAGETEIRYVEKSSCSSLLFISRSF